MRKFNINSIYKVIKLFSLVLLLVLLENSDLYARGKKHKEKKIPPKVGTLTGYVVDDEFEEPLDKAVVTIPGTFISVLTNQQGNFTMKLVAGNYSIKVNYPGFFEKYYNVSVYEDVHTPMFIIKLKPDAVGRDLQRKVSSYQNKIEWPQNAETFNVWQVIEQTGNQEFNNMFRILPSANYRGNGNGYGDSDLSFRGNDPTRTSYTFDGISLNNPETGKVSPVIFSGLTDWAGQIQAIAGQADNLQSATGYGGLINVQSIAPHEKAGADLTGVYGSDGLLKTTATVHTGQSRKGWASVFQVSRTSGNGTVQNTAFEQYGLFLNIWRDVNQFHSFSFKVNAAVQQHDRNEADSIGAYNLYGTKYNRQWGYLNGKALSQSTNYSRSPMFSFTHFWHPRIKTHITTQLYAQFDRSAGYYLGGKLIGQPIDSVPRDADGHIQYDTITNWNQGKEVKRLGTSRTVGTDGKYINSENEGISIFSSISRQDRFGLRTIVTRTINKKTTFAAAFNIEDYRAGYFSAVSNLLGADGFTSYSDLNRLDGFSTGTVFTPGYFKSYNVSDKIGPYYKTEVQSAGLSARLNYENKKYIWYLGGNVSARNMIRTDLYNYQANDPGRKAKTDIKPGGNIQSGIKFNFWKYHYVYLNVNVGSYQPFFASFFPTTNNWKNENAKNEQVIDGELGYTIFSQKLKIEALAYWSQINNRTMVITNNLKSDDAFALINGLRENHRGVELKTSYKLAHNWQFYLNGTLANLKYTKDVTASIYNLANELSAENELGIKNLKIANAPQLSFYAEAEYRLAHNFYVRANYYRAQRNYMPFGVYDFKNIAEGGSYSQAQMPKYNLVGAGGNYLLQIGKSFAMDFFFGGQNLLDKKYIGQSFTGYPESDTRYSANKVFYGTGRTWFVGVKAMF